MVVRVNFLAQLGKSATEIKGVLIEIYGNESTQLFTFGVSRRLD